MASPSAKPAMYGGSNASPARVIQSSRRSPSGPFRLRAGSGSHAGSWLRSLLPLPGEAFGGRFARVERDLRACLDRPESSESGVLRGRLSPRQLDGQAQLGETPRVVLDESLAVETVEVVRSQVVVFDAVAQNVPGGDEDGVSNRDNRLLVSAPSG